MNIPFKPDHDTVALASYRALAWAGRTLPLHTGRVLADAAGTAAFHLLPSVRAVVSENQAQVLGRDADDPLVRASTREAFRSYARYWFDSFHAARFTPEQLASMCEADEGKWVDEALEAGTGAILALPHAGNWDVPAPWARDVAGWPIVSVAEELNPPELFDLFVSNREAMGLEIIPLTGSTRAGKELGKAIADNKVVALVADRDIAGNGIEVTMFGRTRTMPAGPALLALSTGAPLLPTCIYETEEGGWKFVIEPPLTVEETGDRRTDVTALTRALASRFEAFIAACPSGWHMFQPGWPE